jgi:hypothetical protein
MLTRRFSLLVFTFLMLTACGGTGENPVEGTAETSLPEAVTILPTETLRPQPNTQAEVTEELSQVPVDYPVSECTLVSSLPDPSQEYAELFVVTEDDWVIGPEDAAVTIIEYGDFQ